MMYSRTKVDIRRHAVTEFLVRGVPPSEIASMLGVPRETVYNDLRVIRSGNNKELAGYGRRQMLIQLYLNARERSRELWRIAEHARSDYVKLSALREIRVNDQMVLKNLLVLTKALSAQSPDPVELYIDRLKESVAKKMTAKDEEKSKSSARLSASREATIEKGTHYEERKNVEIATAPASPPLRNDENGDGAVGSDHTDDAPVTDAESTQASTRPLPGSVKFRRKPLVSKEVTLQAGSSQRATRGKVEQEKVESRTTDRAECNGKDERKR